MESDQLMQHEASTCMQAGPDILSRDNRQDTSTPFANDSNNSFATEELCRQLRVLVIDGDKQQRQEAEKLLIQCGYNVTSREGIPAASELQTQPSYDLLLVDYPTLSAGDASAVLKSKLPLVLTGTSPDPDQVLKGVNLGAVDFLEKPLPMLKLKCLWQHKVRRMLSNNGSLGRSGSPKAHYTRSQSQPSLPAPATSPNNRYRLSRQRKAAAGAGPGSLLQQQPQKPLQESSNSEQQQQTSAGSQSGPGGAVMSGAESGSATSTSVLAGGTQQGGATAMDADNCDRTSSSLMLHRLDSSQVAGLTSELSHLFMDDPSLTPRQPGGPLKMAGQENTQNQFPTMPPRRCQSAMLPAEPQPQGTVMGHASGRLPDLPEATGMVWGIPTSPLHISPRPAGLPGSSPMMPPQLPTGPMPMPMLPMMMPPMMPPMAGLSPDALLAAGQLAGMPPFMMPGQPFQGGLPGLPLPMLPPDMMMMMSGMQPHPGMDMSCGNTMSMTAAGGPMATSPGMIPTPSPQAQPLHHLPASSSPVGQQQHAVAHSPPTRSSQRRASSSAAANKARRAASMPVPLPAIQPQALVGDSSSAKSLLLDPLAVLGDDPLSGLEPLDPMLLLGVTSLTEDGPMHVSHEDDVLPEDCRDPEVFMNGDSDQPAAPVVPEDVDIDVAGVEDWLLVAAGADNQPLGLTLHKTPSLVDLLMARGLEPTGESSAGIDMNEIDAISCNNIMGSEPPGDTAAGSELEATKTTSTGSVSRTSSRRRAAAA